jgi:hypothetical protein
VSRRRRLGRDGSGPILDADVVAYRSPDPRHGQVVCTACVPFNHEGWENVLRAERLTVHGRECDGGCGRILAPWPPDPTPPPGARRPRRVVSPPTFPPTFPHDKEAPGMRDPRCAT